MSVAPPEPASSRGGSVLTAPPIDAEPPTESEALDAARTLLGDSFRQSETARFVLLSNADTAWTRVQAGHLERAHHQFLRFARRLNLEPDQLRHKLVCVLFEERSDFQQFARAHDEVPDDSIAGYYAPRADRVVFYNPRSNPSVLRASEQLDAMKRDIERERAQVREAERSGRRDESKRQRQTLAQHERHLASETAKVAAFVSEIGVATTIHEAIHQLLFHSGVQSASVQYPMWISEGLATSFETTHPESAFGPDHEYDARRRAFEHLLAEDQLIPLEALVSMSMLPAGNPEEAHMVYQQSYALTTWLARHRRTELGRYLEAMRQEPAGRPTPSRHAAIFEAAFGEAASLERSWLRAERDRSRGVAVADPSAE